MLKLFKYRKFLSRMFACLVWLGFISANYPTSSIQNFESGNKYSYTAVFDNSLNPGTSGDNSSGKIRTLIQFSNKVLIQASSFQANCCKILNSSFFSQYHFFEKNILVRLREPDIIFPFHYFW